MRYALVLLVILMALLVIRLWDEPTTRRSTTGAAEPITSMPAGVGKAEVIIKLMSPEEQLQVLAPSIPPKQFSWILTLDKSNADDWLRTHPTVIKDRDARGFSALHWACRLGKADVVDALIKRGAPIEAKSTGGDLPGETPLSFLMDDVQRPLDKQSTPDDVEFVNTSIRQGCMFSKAPLGPQYLQIAQKLISHGANVNSKNDSGRTPLMKAVYAGHAEIVDLLLRSGASVTMKDDYDKSAMDVACGGNIQKGIRARVKEAFQDQNSKSDGKERE